MDKLIYVAMTGAKHASYQQATVANNLANATTPGFKEELSASRALQAVGGTGYAVRAFTLEQTTGSDFTAGTLQTTGRTLDMAIPTEGFFAIETPSGEAYTRNGSFDMDTQGVLRTKNGLALLGDNLQGGGVGPITVPPNSNLTIALDGTVSVSPINNPAQSTQIARLHLVRPDTTQLDRGTDGFFRPRDGQPVPRDNAVQVVSGALEDSNINAVGQLVKMIDYQRNYDLQVRMLQTADQNARAASQIMVI